MNKVPRKVWKTTIRILYECPVLHCSDQFPLFVYPGFSVPAWLLFCPCSTPPPWAFVAPFFEPHLLKQCRPRLLHGVYFVLFYHIFSCALSQLCVASVVVILWIKHSIFSECRAGLLQRRTLLCSWKWQKNIFVSQSEDQVTGCWVCFTTR